jgi:Bacterial capsule synthesis protein PGA_cap
MYLSELVPLPWRVLKTWERLSLGRPRWIAPCDRVVIRDGAVKAQLVALGDVALVRMRADNVAGRFDGVKSLLEEADIRVANLEAVVTSRCQAALKVAAAMRAEPDAADTLTAAGFDVVSAANNHALDYGPEGLADSLELLRARGIEVCGVTEKSGHARCVTRTVNSIKVGFLGFCDDINAAAATGVLPRPCLWSPEAATAIVAARRDVDVLIVQMHWGYEFSLHPLRRHRDQARRAVELGAQAVICHHAHVPQGFEIWEGCPIVYGLGNGCMPMSSYMIDGHPWADRSIALEMGLVQNGIATIRLHPLRLRRDGSPVLLAGDARHALLTGVTQMSARLRDETFLDHCERTRLVYETVRLITVLQEATIQGGEALEERVAALELPRQQSLIEFLAAHPRTLSLAAAFGAITAARRTGNLPVVLQGQMRELTGALGNVRELYQWRHALRARLP